MTTNRRTPGTSGRTTPKGTRPPTQRAARSGPPSSARRTVADASALLADVTERPTVLRRNLIAAAGTAVLLALLAVSALVGSAGPILFGLLVGAGAVIAVGGAANAIPKPVVAHAPLVLGVTAAVAAGWGAVTGQPLLAACAAVGGALGAMMTLVARDQFAALPEAPPDLLLAARTRGAQVTAVDAAGGANIAAFPSGAVCLLGRASTQTTEPLSEKSVTAFVQRVSQLTRAMPGVTLGGVCLVDGDNVGPVKVPGSAVWLCSRSTMHKALDRAAAGAG